MNALFTPLDMTDYESKFVGYNELPGAAPFKNLQLLKSITDEPFPQTNALSAIEPIENRP